MSVSLRRHPRNPILTRADVPDVPPRLTDATSVFNPGAIKVGDRYHLLLRVQARSRETHLMAADSSDGVEFRVRPEIVNLDGIERVAGRVYHVYDARITPLDGTHYVMVALDMDGSCQLGLARTDDFRDFAFLGIASNEDIRNGVLFPEKVGGRYLRLDRPNKARLEGGPTSGNTIWLSASDDLLHWTPVGPVAAGRFHYWDELIGSGPPPIKTREGWLHVYHGVATHFASASVYQAGVMLLDLRDPSRVLGRCPANILEPREIYELAGQVPNVVFPSGMVVESVDAEGFARPASEVKIYYGAADTVVGLATGTVEDLLTAALEGGVRSQNFNKSNVET
jgi:beta-1,4-mannooligosaccharide/beta-1,4-mannosyl-N-acetylglucosamine phosphorylase